MDKAGANKISQTNKSTYRVIGTNPQRLDGVDKVTGRAVFGADIRLPGMLYGAVLRSPHAHARLISIDTTAAENLPGVKSVITSRDLMEFDQQALATDESLLSRYFNSSNILAREKVLYQGHPIAAVAAVNPHVAEEAIGLIAVEYEILEPVMDVRFAMQPDAPVLLENLREDELGIKKEQPGNVASHIRMELGDIQKGFAEADVVIEQEFVTQMVHQGYIEPQTATALYLEDGQITVWTSTQDPFGVRDQVADILDLPVKRLHIIPMEIGGGFGGKNRVFLEPLVVLLSKKSGSRPVKITMSRAEVLAATGPASGSFIRVKMGAKHNGKITAAEATMMYESGAFPGSAVGSGAGIMFSPYCIENLCVDGYDVVVNKPFTSSYRAPGATNANFAAETVVDELCQKLNLDPIEFREINAAQEGDRNIYGYKLGKVGNVETIAAAKSHPHYTAPDLTVPGKMVGRGIASGFWGNYGGKSSASASVNPDGSISLVTGSVDLSGTRTSLGMQLAEAMGIPLEEVNVRVADTNSVGYTEGSYGSRTTFATGWATYEVSSKLIEELVKRTAQLWDMSPEGITYEAGYFSGTSAESEEQRISLRELAQHLDETGGPVVASSAVLPETSGPAFSVHIADVAVDPETGKVDILRYTAVQDVGTAIHPDYVEGQIHGGVAQGIGWGMSEAFLYDQAGRLTNNSFLDYRMPTSLDLPMIETVLVEVPNPGHPYGVRGVGEAPIIPPPAALGNAIARAIGVHLTNLPMSPDQVLQAILTSKKDD